MAFQTGSQINPALGRVDYTPYMQGAVAGAQSIGQGIASLGQSIGQGIDTYYKKKEQKLQKQQATDFLGNIVNNNAAVAKGLGLQPDASGKIDPKAIQAGVDAVGAGTILDFAMQMDAFQRKSAQEDKIREQQMKAGSAFNRVISKNVDPKTGKLNVGAVFQQAAELGLPADTIAKTLETLSKATETTAVRPVMTLEQAQGQANTMASVAGKDFIGKTTYDEKTGGYAPTIVSKPADVAQPNPFESKVAEQLFTLDQVAKAAPQQIQRIDEQIKLIDEGNVNIGFLGPIKQSFAKARSLLGDKEAGKSVSDTQILESALGEDLIGQIKAAGLTTRSFDTPKEMENLRAALVGSTTLEPAALKQIAELRKKNLKLVIDNYNKKVKSGSYDRMYSLYNEKPSEIELSAPALVTAPSGGEQMKIGRFNVIQSK